MPSSILISRVQEGKHAEPDTCQESKLSCKSCCLFCTWGQLDAAATAADQLQPFAEHQLCPQVPGTWGQPLLDASQLPWPPATPPLPLPAPSGTGSSQGVMRHHFTLEMSSAGIVPESTVYVHLLGPFTARCASSWLSCPIVSSLSSCRLEVQSCAQMSSLDVFLSVSDCAAGWGGP